MFMRAFVQCEPLLQREALEKRERVKELAERTVEQLHAELFEGALDAATQALALLRHDAGVRKGLCVTWEVTLLRNRSLALEGLSRLYGHDLAVRKLPSMGRDQIGLICMRSASGAASGRAASRAGSGHPREAE